MIKWVLATLLLCFSCDLIRYGLRGLYELGKISPITYIILLAFNLIYLIVCGILVNKAKRLENEIKRI